MATDETEGNINPYRDDGTRQVTANTENANALHARVNAEIALRFHNAGSCCCDYAYRPDGTIQSLRITFSETASDRNAAPPQPMSPPTSEPPLPSATIPVRPNSTTHQARKVTTASRPRHRSVSRSSSRRNKLVAVSKCIYGSNCPTDTTNTSTLSDSFSEHLPQSMPPSCDYHKRRLLSPVATSQASSGAKSRPPAAQPRQAAVAVESEVGEYPYKVQHSTSLDQFDAIPPTDAARLHRVYDNVGQDVLLSMIGHVARQRSDERHQVNMRDMDSGSQVGRLDRQVRNLLIEIGEMRQVMAEKDQLLVEAHNADHPSSFAELKRKISALGLQQLSEQVEPVTQPPFPESSKPQPLQQQQQQQNAPLVPRRMCSTPNATPALPDASADSPTPSPSTDSSTASYSADEDTDGPLVADAWGNLAAAATVKDDAVDAGVPDTGPAGSVPDRDDLHPMTVEYSGPLPQARKRQGKDRFSERAGAWLSNRLCGGGLTGPLGKVHVSGFNNDAAAMGQVFNHASLQGGHSGPDE